jgi:hypothetical protein
MLIINRHVAIGQFLISRASLNFSIVGATSVREGEAGHQGSPMDKVSCEALLVYMILVC